MQTRPSGLLSPFEEGLPCWVWRRSCGLHFQLPEPWLSGVISKDVGNT